MWKLCTAALLAAAPIAAAGLQAPPPPPMRGAGAISEESNTAAVSGQVVDARTGAPIAGAVVRVQTTPRVPRTAGTAQRETDQTGRFVFTDLPAGSVSVGASALGYLDSGFAGVSGSVTDQFPIEAGEWISDVRIEMSRPAVIAGTVIDERGEPVVGVQVGVMEQIRLAGRGHYVTGRAAVTDDRGQFRVADLAGGAYLVVVPGARAPEATVRSSPFPGGSPIPPAADASGRPRTYPTIYHPGIRDVAQALPIALDSGDVREGVTVRLEPVVAAPVNGVVEGPDDWRTNLVLRLIPEEASGNGADALETRADREGRFEFPLVPEGRYTLRGVRRWSELSRGIRLGVPMLYRPTGPDFNSSSVDLPSASPGTFLSTTFTAGTDEFVVEQTVDVTWPGLANLFVTARPLGSIAGVIERDVAPRFRVPPGPPAAVLQLDPADGSPDQAGFRRLASMQDATDALSIRGVAPGRYLFRGGGGWLVKSVMWNGRDHTHEPLEVRPASGLSDVRVVVTNAAARLLGTVRGHPDELRRATVVIFPADSERWTDFGLRPPDIRRALVVSGGRFGIEDLPAGAYLVSAMANGNGLELSADTFHRLRSSAVPVTLTWGESRSLDITLEGGR